MTADENFIAPSVFSTGFEDNEAVADVYTRTTASEPIILEEPDPSEDLGLLPDMPGPSKSVLPASPTTVVPDAVNKANPKLGGMLSQASKGLRSALCAVRDVRKQVSVAVSVGKQVQGTVRAVSEGKFSIAANVSLSKDFQSVSGMLQVVGGGKGITGTVNVSAMTSFYGNLVDQASNMGIKNAYTTIAGAVSDRGIMVGVTALASDTATRNSDVGLLGELANGPYARSLNTTRPNFLNEFSASFSLDKAGLKLNAGVSTPGGRLGVGYSSGKGGSSFSGSFNTGGYSQGGLGSFGRPAPLMGFGSNVFARGGAAGRNAANGVDFSFNKGPGGTSVSLDYRGPKGSISAKYEEKMGKIKLSLMGKTALDSMKKINPNYNRVPPKPGQTTAPINLSFYKNASGDFRAAIAAGAIFGKTVAPLGEPRIETRPKTVPIPWNPPPSNARVVDTLDAPKPGYRCEYPDGRIEDYVMDAETTVKRSYVPMEFKYDDESVANELDRLYAKSMAEDDDTAAALSAAEMDELGVF